MRKIEGRGATVCNQDISDLLIVVKSSFLTLRERREGADRGEYRHMSLIVSGDHVSMHIT